MFGVGGPFNDPYALVDRNPGIGFDKAFGRTLVSPALVPEETTAVIVTHGQSLGANTCQGAIYTPTNSAKVQNFNIYNGGLYLATDPLLGCDSELGNYVTRLADKLIAAGAYRRIILVPIAQDGAKVSEWAPGGKINHRIGATARRLAVVGLTPTFLLWHQGESDYGTSASAYTLSLQGVVQTWRNNGISAPFFVALECWASGGIQAGGAAIRQGQADACTNGLGIYLGADWDTMDNTKRYDTTHLNAAGADAAAELDKAVLLNYLATH